MAPHVLLKSDLKDRSVDDAQQ
eukprot:SAG11_NODE_21823_length_418_cov_0.579937_1_plen_21_part_10